ncbi:MAG TPA: RHS repeat-associated core domain-containing protein [Kofleriaceae bacterium]
MFNALGLPEEIWRIAGPGKNGGDRVSASTLFRYGFDAWMKDGAPAWSHTARRTEHDQGGAPFARLDGREQLDLPTRAGWLHSRIYADGSGREAMTKAMAEPGPVPSFDATGHLERRPDGTPATHDAADRWVGTGRTVFDNKGNPVKKYEPFFSDTIAYQDEQELVEWGVTPILRYDPLGRLIRTDQPNGTFARVDFDAWTTRTWDENDTVKDSVWYVHRGSPDPAQPEPTKLPARRAAWLAAHHAGTFSTAHLDTLGRAFLNVADNGPAGRYETRLTLDVKGNQRRLTDPRGVLALEQDFDALGRKTRTNSADAGESRTLVDVSEKPMRTWDPRGYVLRREYDELRRSRYLFVTDPQSATKLAECVIYGELCDQADASNLRGRPYQLYDGAGVVTNEAFDIKGNLETISRTLAKDYRGGLDWASLENEASPPVVAQKVVPLLEAEQFRIDATYDALDRVVSRTTPDGKVTRQTYNEANLIERLEVDGQAYVVDIDYNARGQRLLLEYGNGTQTTYDYDDKTFRLLQQVTTRPASNDTWQDLSYEYDPAGNITQIIDQVSLGRPAHAPNVSPEGDLPLRLAAAYGDRAFVYDALYQLVEARGRHHMGQQADADDAPLASFVHPNDPQGLEPYRETFAHDPAGNILEMSCQPLGGGGGGWTRPYEYATDSNRLLGTGVPGDPPGVRSAAYVHDAGGNIIQMPHLPGMHWDHDNRLQRIETQIRNSGPANNVYFTYDLTDRRVRKIYEHGGLIEEHIYLGGYRRYRQQGAGIELERHTLDVLDGEHRVALVETKTIENSIKATHPDARTRFQLEDHVMSSLMELDDDGSAFSYEEYYPYGETSFRAANTAFDGSTKRYRYNGKERDEETKLYYYGARYYTAGLGRWVSTDPLLYVDGPNPYMYCRNRPISLRDSRGEQSQDTVEQPWMKDRPAEVLDVRRMADYEPQPDSSRTPAQRSRSQRDKVVAPPVSVTEGSCTIDLRVDASRTRGAVTPSAGCESPSEPPARRYGYATRDEAAKAALSEIWEMSQLEGVEYGGSIYKSNGQWGYTKAVTDKSPLHVTITGRGVPKGASSVSAYHTHVGSKDDFINAMNLDVHLRFSDADRQEADSRNMPIYLANYNGEIMRYTPKKGITPLDKLDTHNSIFVSLFPELKQSAPPSSDISKLLHTMSNNYEEIRLHYLQKKFTRQSH